MKGPGYKYCFNISCKEEEGVVHIKGPFSEKTEKFRKEITAMPQNTIYFNVYLNKIDNNILRYFVIFLAPHTLSSLGKHKV